MDILGMGCIALDDVLVVEEYPQPDTKTRIRRRHQQCGGIMATALIAAARLGARCAYAGILGQSEETEIVLRALESEGVSTEHVKLEGEGKPIHTTIVVDQTNHTRTIFSDVQGTVGATEDYPPEEVIRSARVLAVDHYGIEGMTRAARIARDSGIPIVADLERHEWPGFDVLLALVDHLILGRQIAEKITSQSEPEAITHALWNDDRQLVAITDGRHGCWYRSRESAEISHCPAFEVEVVDTTGCGDVFHGAYACALLEDWTPEERIRFATAVAGIKATRFGGTPGTPYRDEVERFLAARA